MIFASKPLIKRGEKLYELIGSNYNISLVKTSDNPDIWYCRISINGVHVGVETADENPEVALKLLENSIKELKYKLAEIV